MSALSACRVTLAAGSDDEEHFQKKDKARLARDKLRLNPVVLGGTTMLCDLVHPDSTTPVCLRVVMLIARTGPQTCSYSGLGSIHPRRRYRSVER